MSIYEELLETYKKDMADNKPDRAIDNMLAVLDNLGRSRKYDQLQEVMDKCNVEEFDASAIHVIQLVTWWHGDKVERDDFLTRSEAYFVKLKGEKFAKQMMKGIKSKSWKPMFGGTWEKDLLTGAE